MEFSRQEYWNGFPCPSPEDLANPGIEPRSPILQADSLQSERDNGESLVFIIKVSRNGAWGAYPNGEQQD